MNSENDTFDIIILVARPAAGKSEIIDYLKRTPIEKRKELFHIGEFEEIDDFPMLWTWFEEDALLVNAGHPRLYTDEENYFKEDYLWDLLIEKMCLEYDKKIRDFTNYHENKTVIIEFARGKEHGGFKRAFDNLSQSVLQNAAILYIDVSWEESLRKNLARFNPERPDSILEHGLSKEKMELLYRDSDWSEIIAEYPEYLYIQGVKVPYIVFHNEDDVTTGRGDELGQRLEDTLKKLIILHNKK